MSSIEGKVVVITGASSGIGAATAKKLGSLGAKVMLGARREQRLEELADTIVKASGEADYRVTDVTDRAQVQALADAAIERYGHVDVMFNNAGLMPLSFLASRKVEEWERMVDVNIKGVLYGIDAVLNHMLERGDGHIINVSSVAGHKVLPAGSVYCGTKFAVRAISEGLRQEVGEKIRTTVISPGAIRTELPDTITEDKVRDNLGKVFNLAIDPDAIARSVVYAMEQPRDVDVNEILIRPTAQSN